MRDRPAYTTEDGSLDEQTRILHSLDLLAERESETALGHLFQYWRRRCDGDRPPLEDTFNPREVLPPELNLQLWWIDVTPENPLNFVLQGHKGIAISNMSGKRLREVPYKIHMTACAAEYLRCKSFLQPMYHEIDQNIGGISRQYVGLLVPVKNRKGRITKLYNAGRLIFLERSDRFGLRESGRR